MTLGSVSLLWHLRAENGIKVVVYLHLVVGIGELLHLAVELGERFIFQSHDFLYLLLRDCDCGFWQSGH